MDQRIQEIGSIIHQLPTDNLKMLHSLIKHLKKYVIFLLITIYFYSISYYSICGVQSCPLIILQYHPISLQL